MSLKEIREQIDNIDKKILLLLDKRFYFAKKTKKYKKNVLDSDREKEIIDKALSKNYKTMDKKAVLEILKTILKESKRLQVKK